MLSFRVARCHRVGTSEAIPEEQLLAWADPNDSDGDGFQVSKLGRGRFSDEAIGRFAWKANQPHTSARSCFFWRSGCHLSLFPNENHSSHQHDLGLHKYSSGGDPEIPDRLLEHVILYCQTIAVPAQRTPLELDVQAGEKLFHQMKCNACHVSSTTTGPHSIAALSNQKIRPFTDLLLHDMGEGLADGRPDFKANGREWRTAPLWGIGLVKTVNKHTRFLHDGRARNLEEAILWHGGEAERSKQKYLHLTFKERQQVLKFLNSL